MRLGGSANPRRPAADIAADNVAAVAEAVALVAVLPETAETVSSVWLEIGIALATARPTVIVARSGIEVPFLIRASAAASPGHVAIVEAAFTAEATAKDVVAAINRISRPGDQPE
ncbi:hypothetical protein [Arthrobacter sp. S2(2024)]|uniref:hypothetical protein n=1 Tax=Arthrobacter sp. S2(2024) TaxID=3111911 RepID=UPI002FCA92FD